MRKPDAIEPTTKGRNTKPVPALVKATQILDRVSRESRPMRAAELSRALGLSKSTVHVLCATLADLGLLARVGDTQFSIGPHVLSWSGAFQNQSDLTREFTRVWDELNLLPHETINLSILSGTDVMYIACRNGTSPLGVSFRIGMRLPAPFTATGKAMLSTMRDPEVRTLFHRAWPQPMTRSSVRSVDDLLVELEETRRRGFSIDNGQSREGAYCFGAPVFEPSGPIAAAGVAVALLAIDVNPDSTATAGAAVRTVAARLSRRLGGKIGNEET